MQESDKHVRVGHFLIKDRRDCRPEMRKMFEAFTRFERPLRDRERIRVSRHVSFARLQQPRQEIRLTGAALSMHILDSHTSRVSRRGIDSQQGSVCSVRVP